MMAGPLASLVSSQQLSRHFDVSLEQRHIAFDGLVVICNGVGSIICLCLTALVTNVDM